MPPRTADRSSHSERMVTIFEAIIREGAQAGEIDADDAAQAARAVRSAFMPFFHPIMAFFPTERTRCILLWMLSTKFMPAVGVLVPIYLLLSQAGLLDTKTGLIIITVFSNITPAKPVSALAAMRPLWGILSHDSTVAQQRHFNI
jgi:hypothetical protein